MRNRKEFLGELSRIAERALSPVEADALISETEAHLDEAIQARLELGLGMEEAEQEALSAFGHPSVVASSQRRLEARRTWLGAIFVALAVFGLLPPMWLWSLPLSPGWLLLFLVARYAHACWKARKPMQVSIAAALFTAIFVPAMDVAGLSNGGFGHACRQLLYEWPRTDLARLGWFHPDWEWIPYAQGAVDAAYEWRFALGALLLATLGVDFIFGMAGAIAADIRQRRRSWHRV